MAGRLEGKVALISGSGGGQGRVAVTRFAQEGAKVVCCDLNGPGNDETVAMARREGGDVVGIAPLDVADPNAADKWVREAADRHGRIDILYNNASATRFAPISSMTNDDWRFVMKNEIDIVFFPTRAAWPHLIESRGVVINIGSIAGMVGSRTAGAVAHSTAKGAIIAMTRQLAAEGGPHGVRSVCISPGTVVTPGTAEFVNEPKMKGILLGDTLIGRLGEPEDVVELAIFVASKDAGYITGANLMVDGGTTAF